MNDTENFKNRRKQMTEQLFLLIAAQKVSSTNYDAVTSYNMQFINESLELTQSSKLINSPLELGNH